MHHTAEFRCMNCKFLHMLWLYNTDFQSTVCSLDWMYIHKSIYIRPIRVGLQSPWRWLIHRNQQGLDVRLDVWWHVWTSDHHHVWCELTDSHVYDLFFIPMRIQSHYLNLTVYDDVIKNPRGELTMHVFFARIIHAGCRMVFFLVFFSRCRRDHTVVCCCLINLSVCSTNDSLTNTWLPLRT